MSDQDQPPERFRVIAMPRNLKTQRPGDRRIVVHQRTPADVPDAVMRAPKHFCIDCGQSLTACPQCHQPYQLLDAREGQHFAYCPSHGRFAVDCQAKKAIEVADLDELDQPPPITDAKVEKMLARGTVSQAQAREMIGLARPGATEATPGPSTQCRHCKGTGLHCTAEELAETLRINTRIDRLARLLAHDKLIPTGTACFCIGFALGMALLAVLFYFYS